MAKKIKKTAKKVSKKPVKKTLVRTQTATPGIGIRPLGDRVVVRPLTEDELGTKSPSGIIIPDTVSKERPEQGVVVAVGTGKYVDGTRVALEVAVGDRVVFAKYGFEEVKVGGKDYYVVGESNLLAVIRD